jgi:hypothetical protein
MPQPKAGDSELYVGSTVLVGPHQRCARDMPPTGEIRLWGSTPGMTGDRVNNEGVSR